MVVCLLYYCLSIFGFRIVCLICLRSVDRRFLTYIIVFLCVCLHRRRTRSFLLIHIDFYQLVYFQQLVVMSLVFYLLRTLIVDFYPSIARCPDRICIGSVALIPLPVRLMDRLFYMELVSYLRLFLLKSLWRFSTSLLCPCLFHGIELLYLLVFSLISHSRIQIQSSILREMI